MKKLYIIDLPFKKKVLSDVMLATESIFCLKMR